MTVDEAYRLISFIVNKSNAQGYVSPDEFNLIINKAQESFLDYLLGEFQQYQYGRAQARVQFGQNSIIRQRLSPVIYGRNLSVDSTGFSPYPEDYVQTDAMWDIYGYSTRIRYFQQDALFSALNSTIDPVASNPVYIIEKNGFRFFPNNIGAAKLNYVHKPRAIVWASVYGSVRPTYDPTESVDPVWTDVDMLEIIARALRMAGVNLKDGEVSQYANEIKTQGQ
jgi:hypothetical protein